METYINIKSFMWMLTVTLLVIAKNWKWSKCPSMLSRHTTMVHPYTEISLSSKKDQTPDRCNHKCGMLSKRSQTQRLHTTWSHLYDILEYPKLQKQKLIWDWLPGAGGGRKVWQQRDSMQLFRVLYRDYGGGQSTAIMCQNSQLCQPKSVNCCT